MTAKKSTGLKNLRSKTTAKKTATTKKKTIVSTAKLVRKTALKKPARPGARLKVGKSSPGGIALIRHFDFSEKKPQRLDVNKAKVEVLKRMKTSPPNINFKLEPLEDDCIVYHQTPGFTSQESPLAQLSVLATVINSGTNTVDLDRVVLEYKKGNQTLKKDIFLPMNDLIIEPGFGWNWQNSRPYHEKGDVVFLETPFPTKVKLSFYFKGYRGPVSVSKKLKPYSLALAFPFDKKDFEKDEYISGYSMHGGGSQVFAYDLGAQAYESDAWRDLHPGKDWTENKNYRIWGKPVRAMANGVVLHYENNIPNNWKPDGTDEGLKKQKDELWGSFDYGGAGNHLYIRHGDVVALYAHFQKGSLTAKFAKNGSIVKKGDVLGKAGNSGNSTGPHLHTHIKTYKTDNDPDGGIFRPLLFNTGFAIGKHKYLKPKSNVSWSKLNKQGIPGLKSKACFVFPSEKHPYCEYPTNWGEVCRFGVRNDKFQEEFDKVWTCGYYPIWIDGYDVNGKTYFNVIFRSSKNIAWVARNNMGSAKYQTEFTKWTNAGYRLINVNSYLLNGKIRYAAVWKKDKTVKFFAYHGRSLSWHENNFEKHYKAGWVPRNVSCVAIGNKTYVTALWEKKNTGGFYLRPAMTLQNFKDYFDQYTNKKKFKLVYLDAYVKGGKPMLSGIWYKNAPNYNSWWEKYNLSANQFQTEYNNMLDNDYLTRCIAGYSQGGSARFEGIWSK